MRLSECTFSARFTELEKIDHEPRVFEHWIMYWLKHGLNLIGPGSFLPFAQHRVSDARTVLVVGHGGTHVNGTTPELRLQY